MIHIFRKGSNEEAPTLLLLHGTGGTENDLLPLGNVISPSSSVLSVRGNVIENGMPRFFKRLAEGVFDIDDLVARTTELKQFIDDAARQYQFNRHNVVAIGYSNGANIAASILFHYTNALKGAILHHPMVPRYGIQLPSLLGTNVFIAAGKNDPICPSSQSEDLYQLLTDAGASVTLHWENYGHQLTNHEVEAASKWFQKTFL